MKESWPSNLAYASLPFSITYHNVVVFLQGSKPDVKFDADRRSRRNFETGDQVDALICRISPRGLLLRISHTSIKGMCRREEVSASRLRPA